MKKNTLNSTSINRYNPDINFGLNSAQVQYYIDNGLSNHSVAAPSRTVKQIICGNIFTYFNLIFFVLMLLVLSTGEYKNILFMCIIVANTLIGIIQEIRAKKTLDKLTVLSTPHVNTIREGTEVSLAPDELVWDDIVIFSSGNQICADAIIVEGEVEVNESLITGESDAVKKKKGDTLLSGSFILSGNCRAKLDKVGSDSFAAKLTIEAKRQKKSDSEMMRSLDKLIKFIGIVIIPLAVAMYLNNSQVLKLNSSKAILKTVGAITSMIPEGLYLLVSVALAVSVIKLAQHNTLIHEMYCIETLARVDVLCLDKTGTITSGKMEVKNLINLSDTLNESDLNQILSAFTKYSSDNNATAQALKAKFHDDINWKCSSSVAFSSARKWSAVTLSSELDNSDQKTYIIGAAEFILKKNFKKYKDLIDNYSSEGHRVLLLAEFNSTLDENTDTSTALPLAFILIQDEIRPSAEETLKYFYEQGVDIKIISGDNPVTVSNIAARSGLRNADKFIDATTLKTQEDINEAASKFNVFGRVTPDQKRMLVKSLQKLGHTVAMTGDGVNDVLALKDANCSIAMASGSDAACQVAQLVLLDSDFKSMPKVVLEGRRVINNIERSASLFLVKTIYSFIFTLLNLTFSLTYPFEPIQLSLLSSLTVGIPSFVLALEPNKARVKGKFFSNVLSVALPGAIAYLVNMVGISLVCPLLGFSAAKMSSISTILAGFTGVLILYQICKPLNFKRLSLCLIITLAFISSIFFFPDFFEIVKLDISSILICLSFILIVILILKLMFSISFNKFNKTSKTEN